MKFAKHLDGNLVVEWSTRYFNEGRQYKKGKKLLHRIESTASDGRSAVSGDNEALARSTATERHNVFDDLEGSEHSAYDFDPSTSSSLAAQSTDQIRRELHRARYGSRGLTRRASRESRRGSAGSQAAQQDFLNFLDNEADKINTFFSHKLKELEERSQMIQLQVNEMNSRRKSERHILKGRALSGKMTKPMKEVFARAQKGLIRVIHGTDYDMNVRAVDRDYVAYRRAKLKLQLALQEHYHEMEYLQNYQSLNLTAFRKILKKFDKLSGRSLSKEYMQKVVDAGPLGSAHDLDGLIVETEQLYATTFERGNRKHAINRLRSPMSAKEFSWTMSRNGLYIGLSVPLLLEGIVYALKSDNAKTTSQYFLLQIWAAFFLIILFLLLFGVNCFIWSANRVNYPFIFDFDYRTSLSWQQYFELPSFTLFIFSILFWMNFRDFFESFRYYYPVVFLGAALLVLFNPFPLPFRPARRWFLTSNLRLLFSGLVAVHFQDFFLGDQYNSLAYSMGNTELFFCVYAHKWKGVEVCSSSHSALLGFFTTLPGIWRLLQCLRRLAETRNAFPHLANAGKYACTILSYMFLSLWRRHPTTYFKALFILFATFNSVYTSTWDLVMDWSMFQHRAAYPFLRKQLVYPWIWVYYAALVLDPILRFSWIFYAIFPNRIQHSAVTSFFIALAEIFRRFMWNIFRVENEEAFNQAHLRVSKDVDLPYVLSTGQRELETASSRASTREMVGMKHREDFTKRDDSQFPASSAATADDDSTDETAGHEDEDEDHDQDRSTLGDTDHEATSNEAD